MADLLGNSFDANGLTLATQAQVLAFLTTSYQAIYGTNVNLDPDTPDGQWINIIVQAILDVEDLLANVYTSFDPDNAIGVTLDQRVAINGIQREGGTFTTTPITIVTTQSVNLYGLDQTAQPVYTVADQSNNQWQLITSSIGLVAGTHVLEFQSAIPGQVLTIPNTITVPVSIVIGVSSINNPTSYTTLGVNEESDALLKVRRQKSVANGSQGYLAGLIGVLGNISGVTYSDVFENTTGATDGNGIPGHSIWVIVAGTGAPVDIANAIYTKRNAGCGMKGSISFPITQVDGSIFFVFWDDVATQELFITFMVSSINGSTPPNITAIRDGIPTLVTPGVHATVNVNQIVAAVQALDSNTLATSVGLSIGTMQTATLSGVAASGSFTLNYAGNASTAINWNDSIGTIQAKLQAIMGLATATVTGSIASQSLVFNLSTVTVEGLLTVTSNTLMTSAPAAITFSWNENYSTTFLTPAMLNDQFVLSEANIIILPMQLQPSSSTVLHTTGTVFFQGLGGYGTLTYTFQTNNSGGSINGATGFYTAGSTGGVTDTLLVTDAFGNTATATVTVT